ncbi:MAG TPA: type II secretion system protein [Nitrosomonas halophila]|nr:type II secretion system protein [Nitrosomonas halophila]
MQQSTERGYIYLWTLFAVMLAGVMLAGAGQMWQTAAKREKELELLFVGDQFRRAIESYYDSSQAGRTSRYPESLEQLLKDERSPAIRRHLRKIFIDPMTNSHEWGLIEQQEGGITGVYSLSTGTPLKRANFPEEYSIFEKAKSYQDWKFSHAKGAAAGQADPSTPTPQSDSPATPFNPFSQSQPAADANPFAPGQSPAGGNPFIQE